MTNLMCATCGKTFSVLLDNPPEEKAYCSRECAALVRESNEELRWAVRQAIRTAGRYLSLEDVTQIVGISSKTLYGAGLSIPALNSEEGYDQPLWAFASHVGEALRELFCQVAVEKTFEGCLSPKGYRLRYDYYVEDHKLLVEADGSQHWDVESEWYSDYRLECDQIKDRWAAANGYLLIRIPYTPKAKQIRKQEVCRVIVEELRSSAAILEAKYQELKAKIPSPKEVSLPFTGLDPSEPHEYRRLDSEREGGRSEILKGGIPKSAILCLCGLAYGRHERHSVIGSPKGQPVIIYTASPGPLPEPTKFVCQREHCRKEFTITTYRPSKAHILLKKYCSLSCNGSKGYNQEDLEDLVFDYLTREGEWRSCGQVAKALGVSKSTLWRFKIDIVGMNQKLGYEDPERPYAVSINMIRTAIRKAGRKLSGQEMAGVIGGTYSLVTKLGLSIAEMNALEGFVGGDRMPNGGYRKSKIREEKLSQFKVPITGILPEPVVAPKPLEEKPKPGVFLKEKK